jgi:hypothetical protein
LREAVFDIQAVEFDLRVGFGVRSDLLVYVPHVTVLVVVCIVVLLVFSVFFVVVSCCDMC